MPAIHWFNHKRGIWPYAACGAAIPSELSEEYSLWPQRVTCFPCRDSAEALRELPFTPVQGHFPQIRKWIFTDGTIRS